MPWGKHKGVSLNRVPRDYLVWALNNADSMSPDLRAVIERILGITPEEGKQEDPGNSSLRQAWEASVRKVKELERKIKTLEAQLGSNEPLKLSDTDQFRRIVKGWYRAMSLIYHPDRGGSKESQAILNVCYSELNRRLESEA
jgi:hypothetical protein